MKAWRYSRWDDTQEPFSLDAKRALDALSDLLMEGLDVDEALEWMRQHGFELGGLDLRVMGTDELMEELRREAEALYERYDLGSATDELERRLEEVLDREERALRRTHGVESARITQEPLELHSTEIPAESTVLLVLGSANRDEGTFDQPDELDIRRTPNPHLAFGRGRHSCIGDPLVERQMKAAIEGNCVGLAVARSVYMMRVYMP